MYHLITFLRKRWVDLEQPNGKPPVTVRLRRGTVRRARVRPRVLEYHRGPVEAADLYFEDGTAARGVLLAYPLRILSGTEYYIRISGSRSAGARRP
jgi:hypothetical protein